MARAAAEATALLACLTRDYRWARLDESGPAVNEYTAS